MIEPQHSIKVLKSKGYKLTQPRKQVLNVLARADKPVSPYDIQKTLRQQGNQLNHVTIYRILDLLCEIKLAHKVLSLGGYVICAIGDKDGCHRFMVCRSCGGLQEFASKALCQEENEIAHDLGFCSEQHLSEFLGLCSQCQDNKSNPL